MSSIAYKIFATCTSRVYGKMITGKRISNTPNILHYEIAQHLGFSFQQTIDYESSTTRIIQPLIVRGSTVFDIGGNIGQFALVFSEWVGRDGSVVSIEPDPRTFAFLTFNQLINQLGQLKCIRAGVGACEGELPFKPDTKTGGRRGSFTHQPSSSQLDCALTKTPIVTLDKLVETHGVPSFIKIDVEGFECEALKGLSIDLEACVFLVEVRKDTKDWVYDYFHSRGYRCDMISDSVESIKCSSDIPDFANLLFLRK